MGHLDASERTGKQTPHIWTHLNGASRTSSTCGDRAAVGVARGPSKTLDPRERALDWTVGPHHFAPTLAHYSCERRSSPIIIEYLCISGVTERPCKTIEPATTTKVMSARVRATDPDTPCDSAWAR